MEHTLTHTHTQDSNQKIFQSPATSENSNTLNLNSQNCVLFFIQIVSQIEVSLKTISFFQSIKKIE